MSAELGTHAIEVDGLVKRYGPDAGVDHVSFVVEPGEVFVLLGPNGAGKTTTVEILEGLRKRDAGRVTVLGHEPASRGLAHRIGVMPQQGDLYAGIRTEEAVRLFASFYDEPEDPEALMQRTGVDRVRKTTYRRLSGGERRRLSLALALVGRPELVFLDEPTAEMDIEGRRATWDIVAELKERGTTVVLTTHHLDESSKLADRVAILRRGSLVALGTPAELSARGDARVTFQTATDIDPERLTVALGVPVTRTGAESYRIESGDPTPDLISRLATWLTARGVLIRRLDVGPRSLEEVYLELTR
ncbi:MAG: ABC transporter ATP-binding protein [Actinomycetota bacterium]